MLLGLKTTILEMEFAATISNQIHRKIIPKSKSVKIISNSSAIPKLPIIHT